MNSERKDTEERGERRQGCDGGAVRQERGREREGQGGCRQKGEKIVTVEVEEGRRWRRMEGGRGEVGGGGGRAEEHGWRAG